MAKKILIQIDGCIETNLTHDECLDQFIEWLESRSECFGGGTVDITEEGSLEDGQPG